MTFDLDAARALHDRDADDPRYCGTCTDPAGAHPVAWPCPTATALGATGRTEWDGPLADGGLGAALRAAMNTAGAGVLYVPKIIEFDPNTETVTNNGVVPKPTTCGHRHEGEHGDDFPCVLVANHGANHIDEDGDLWDHHMCRDCPPTTTVIPAPEWPNHLDPCPEHTDSDKRCIQHRGHEGHHYYSPTTGYTPCFAPRPGTASYCSLETGHRGSHQNANGVAWNSAADTNHLDQ